MLKKIALLTLLTLGSLSARGIKPIVQLSYDVGGTKLATIHHDVDNDYTIRAGEGLNFELGASMGNRKLELQFLAGVKIDEDSASNGDVSWYTFPLTALGIFKFKKWKIGAGATYHMNPELSGSFSGYDDQGRYFNDSVEDTYEDTLGGVVKIQYQVSESLDFGLKGTLIEYKLKRDNSQTANGNNVGITLTYTFGNDQYQFR